MKKYLLGSFFVLILAVVVIAGGSGMMLKANASTSTSTAQTINVTVNEVITLSLSTSTLNLAALTPGVPVFAISTTTVTTNAPSGFTLSVNRNNTSSTITSSSIQFPDATSFSGANATTSPGSNLSFRENLTGTTAGDYNTATWGASDASGTAMFAGFPTASQAFSSTSTYVGTSQNVVMQIRADSPATQQATSYTGGITITALALP